MRKPDNTITVLESKWIAQDHGYLTPCWIWQRNTDQAGYGRHGSKRAHRMVYESRIGPIPEGLTLDHLCRVHACVNPDHLEPVTRAVNVMRGEGHAAVNARKTHCVRGHKFDERNTFIRPEGWRACRACHRGQRNRKAAR